MLLAGTMSTATEETIAAASSAAIEAAAAAAAAAETDEALQKSEERCLADALLVAAEKGQTETVRELLAKGCKPNVFNKFNDTPLHWACANGHEDGAEDWW